MSNSLVVAQGPIQLIQAIAVLRTISDHSPSGGGDVLLLGGMGLDGSERDSLHDVCKRLASLWSFSKVEDAPIDRLRCSPDEWQREISNLAKRFESENPRRILVCRNTQFVNEVALGAFPEAQRIAYGDSLGVADVRPAGTPSPYRPQGLFDVHANYAVFPSLRQPEAWSDHPPTRIEPAVLADILAKAADLLPEIDTIAERLLAELGQNPTLVLTSYLTEAHQLANPENELMALAEVVIPATLPGERIVVKGHPRERHGQSTRLADMLARAGRKVILLDEIRHFPIEVLLQRWKPAKAFTFLSSSSIPLAWIAGCELHVGFGRRALSRMHSTRLAELLLVEEALALQARNAYLGEAHPVVRWDRSVPGQFHHLPIRLTRDLALAAKTHAFGERLLLEAPPTSTASRVRRLHLGSGVKRMLGYIDVDAFVAARGILPVSHVELPHQTASVDEILSEHSLEHIGKYEVPRALAEWSRVLRPGGRLLMNLPNLEWCMKAWLAAPEETRWGWQLDTIFGLQDHPGEYHKTGFTAPRLNQLLSEAGFTNIRISDFWSHGQGCFWVEAMRDDALRESPEGRAALSPGFEVLERTGFGPTEAVGGASLIGTQASFKIPVGSGTDLLRVRFDIALPEEYKGAQQVLEIQTGNGKTQNVTLSAQAPRLTASLEIPAPKGDVLFRLRCLHPGANVEGVEVGVLVGNLRFLASRDAKSIEEANSRLPAAVDEALEKALAIHVAGEAPVARRRISQIATTSQGIQVERALILVQLRSPEAALWELEGLDDTPGVRLLRAAAWLGMGDCQRADALLSGGDWSTVAGKDTVARLAARRAAREGRWDDVRLQMESIDPDGRSPLDVLFMAACQLLSGRRDESFETAENLFQGNCDDESLRGWIETLLACKENQAAARWLQAATETNPAQWFEWAVRLRALGLDAPARPDNSPLSAQLANQASTKSDGTASDGALEAIETAAIARARGDLATENQFLSKAASLTDPASPLSHVLQARRAVDGIRTGRRAVLPSDPLVSIVIPVHNGKQLTATCLECLDKVGSSVRHEIVVVDDASNDGTLEHLRELEARGKIRLVVHETNQGFARSCNDGAKASRGDILVFLNNDTLPLPGWLEVLSDELRRDLSVGAAGSKLLYPDGTIQHAGMVWERPDRPNPEHVFRKVRGEAAEVGVTLDYPAVTGACFAVPAALFRELDGFSLEFGMYSEDVDFCLRLWERGLRVRYCAHSRVIHLESATPMDNEVRAERVRLAADRLRKSWHDRWPAAFAAMPNWMWPQQVRTAKPLATTRGDRPRIGFDGRTFSVADSVVRGIGHYTIHHLQAILTERPDADVTVLYFDGFPPLDDIKLPIEALGGKWASWSSCQASDFDIFHTPDPMYVHPQFCNPFQRYGSTRTTSTFYDLIPLRIYPGQIGNWPGYLARLDAIKHSNARLLCISEYTRTDLLQATGMDNSRATTIMAGFIGSGATAEPTEYEARELMSRLGITGSFFLHVGATDPHKNFEASVNATIPLAQRHGCQLVVVGKISNAIAAARDQILKAGLRHVVFTDFLSRRDLEILYSRATATLFLSRYEGFGLPPLEAMAAGCPVVCSNVTSLPEVVGDAAIVHAPDDLAGIATTLEKLLTDSVLRHDLSSKGKVRSRMFRWEDVAKKTWQVWDEMILEPAPPAQPAPEKAKVRWISPIWDPSGYADESRPFVKHLASTDLGLSIMGTGRHSESFRQAVPLAERRRIDDLMGRESYDDSVGVLSMPASGLGRFPGVKYHVGRTMFETDSLPSEWVAHCNQLEEIWVPSRFNVESFRRAGVVKPMLIVPGGIDTDKFRPGIEPLAIPVPARSTTFLAVFEWTLRKSPDLLFAAWARTFSDRDDVRLVVRAYPPNHIEGDPVAWVEEQIDAILAREGKSRTGCAPIVVLAKQIPDAEMPRLYAAADVYLAPSRGEGWGRPHMEAMSSGVPVIATRWSGNLEFQTDDNSWLLDIDGLEEIDARAEFPFYRGQHWARPSLSHLCALLKIAATDPDRRRALGAKARRDMVEIWDWKNIAPLAEIRLREILEGIPPERSKLAARATKRIPDESSPAKLPVRWCGQLFNYSGYARLGREAVAGLMDLGIPVTADPLLNDKNWFMGLKQGSGMDRWRTLLSRPPEPGILVSCDIPRDASGHNELFEQIAEANPGCPSRVGWTMFETDRLPTGWARTLNKLDEVWVPSEFNRKTFSDAGVDPTKLHVIPGSIDPGPYLAAAPMDLPGRKAATTYLSVFQWVRRKGWDVLLKAWAQAFQPSDDVRLVLRCHPFGDTGLSMRDIFRQALAELGLREGDMAPILHIEDFVAESDMPRLYAACDLFVLPSRGEGWGLPYLEAMAAGKPCIATAWGASLEFLDQDNSWLIDPRQPVCVDRAACEENPYLGPDHLWADPDPIQVARLLRLTATSKEGYREKSERSRADALSKWSPRTTAAAIERRLLALQSKPKGSTAPPPAPRTLEHAGNGRLSDALAKVARGLKETGSASNPKTEAAGNSASTLPVPRRSPVPEPKGRKLSIRWEGSQFIHHSLAHVNRELCLGLAKAGHELSLIPFEPDQFAPESDPRLSPLAKLVNAPLDHTCDIHLRHQWPPNLEAPKEGKWVVVQPWEFGSPPKDWIPAFSTQVDELWAYTDHVRQMYLEAGVPPEIVKVVPLGVDCDIFRPGLSPMKLATRRSFKFLFVGGTIARKGFDVLLNAWKEAFGPDDDVCLVVKDIGGKSFYKGQTGADWIREMQASGKCAEIEYIDTELQPSQLPGLYAACDVLVHPYRGEGFGLPIAEAMACGLPCVVTRGGAADDFCTDAESWGVSSQRVPVPGGKVGPFETVAAPWWLEPSVPDLVDKLRQACSDTPARSRKGAAARGRIALHFSWDKAVEIAQSRLRELADKPPRRKASSTVGGKSFSKLADMSAVKTESVKPDVDPKAEASPALENLNRLLFKAEAAAARGDIAESDRLTEEAVDAHPDQHLAWLARAMVLRGLGKHRKAIDAVDRCLKLNPVPEALLEAFQIHILAGENGPAKRIEKILKDQHAAWLKLAREEFRARGQGWPLDATKPTKSVTKSPAPPRKGKH